MQISNEWIMDSGCSFHMSPNRDWFSAYEAIAGGVVLTGNNAAYKVAGIGPIRIKMHHGIIRTLTDVRHVPNLEGILFQWPPLMLVGSCRWLKVE